METILIYDLLKRRALVTRESARSIGNAISQALARSSSELALDFSNVQAVTPSFVDEVLNVIADELTEQSRASLRILFLNSPTRLSAKFSAVGRSHGLGITESSPGIWSIVPETVQPTA